MIKDRNETLNFGDTYRKVETSEFTEVFLIKTVRRNGCRKRDNTSHALEAAKEQKIQRAKEVELWYCETQGDFYSATIPRPSSEPFLAIAEVSSALTISL